jgi:glycosyltransferase involved in cell wall biosynthesis
MYLPLSFDGHEDKKDIPIFFGAINIYLKEILPIYRHAPRWLEHLLDSRLLLNLAARKSGSTHAAGLEEMTISMLMGEDGRQASELDHLIGYLKKDKKPDIIHLSNALLLGLAKRLKTDLGVKVICSLQDENEWIDLMNQSYQEKVWQLMRDRVGYVDYFISASKFYAEKSQKQLHIPTAKIKVVYGGLHAQQYEKSSLPLDPPVIGYLCRLSEYFGLGILFDAFLQLKKDSLYSNLKLYLTGGMAGNDQAYVDHLFKIAKENRIDQDIHLFSEFAKSDRINFLKSLTLLSVPVPTGESFGGYQVEALAAGVPIVQPNVGCYPEFIKQTRGGIIYEPNDSATLAHTIASLLRQPQELKKLSDQGYCSIREDFSIEKMAEKLITVYEEVLQNSD